MLEKQNKMHSICIYQKKVLPLCAICKKSFFTNFILLTTMKLNKIFAAFMLIAAVAFTACNQNPPVNPNNPGNGQDTTQNGDTTQNPPVETVAPDTAGWNIPAECLTVAQAREICAGLTTEDQTSTEEYYVMGWVKNVEEVSASYGNATFYIEDVKGANSKEDFQAYRVKGLDGNKITNEAGVAVGDFVVIYGKIKQFYEKAETATGAYIWKSTNSGLGEVGGTGNSGNTGDTGNTGNGGTSTDSDIAVPADALVFDADEDQGTATIDHNQAAAYEVVKDGVTLAVTKGCLGTYNNEVHYRIYKNETLTITSTAGNIKEVVFTCTGNVGDEKYGPDKFTVDGGEYVYSGANGQWKGDASTVTFTASVQVRASQIAVVVE